MAAKWPALARLKRLISMINSFFLRLVCPDFFPCTLPAFTELVQSGVNILLSVALQPKCVASSLCNP